MSDDPIYSEEGMRRLMIGVLEQAVDEAAGRMPGSPNAIRRLEAIMWLDDNMAEWCELLGVGLVHSQWNDWIDELPLDDIVRAARYQWKNLPEYKRARYG